MNTNTLRAFCGLVERMKPMPYHAFPRLLMCKHAQQAEFGAGGFSVVERGRVVDFKYAVPSYLCTGAGGTMPLSAILAVLDETSSFASIACDEHLRPGVSVGLTATSVRPVGPSAGETLTFRSKVVRLGRKLGWIDCVVLGDDGALVAQGRHTKYLDMGAAWNLLPHPDDASFPLMRQLALLTGHPAQPVVAVDDEAARPTRIAERMGFYPAEGGRLVAADGSARASFECKDSDMNGAPGQMAGMHGGAQAMLHEAACSAAAPKGARLRRIDVTYLSSVKRGRLAVGVDAPVLLGGGLRAVRSAITRADADASLSEAHLEFECTS
jgi:acyl-coenzyme A thioesterase PaaI-like protein